MGLLLSGCNLNKSFGEKEVLKDISFAIRERERIGLVGANGSGKSTLAAVIAGILDFDSGVLLKHKKNLRIAYLDQDVYKDTDLLPLPNSHNSQESFVDHHALLAVSKRLKVKDKLWGDPVTRQRLSGGEKTRLHLTRVWISEPDLLILDEPTNNLDAEGIEWLHRELETFKGSVILISHDRYFLDSCAERILEMDNGCLTEYAGNYSFYRDTKQQDLASKLQAYAAQEKYKSKITEEINRLKGWSEKAHAESTQKEGFKEYYRVKAKKMDKAVKSKIRRLEKLQTEGLEKPKEEKRIKFNFNAAGDKGQRILAAQDLGKAYGRQVLFKDSSFFVSRGEKVGIVGPNGCGKTTLLRLVMSVEKADKGELYLNPNLKFAYLNQDFLDLPGERGFLQFLGAEKGSRRTEALTLMANMALDKTLWHKSLGQLSLGEKMKVKIISLILDDYNLLLLDEPTNHLDLPSREKLEESLLSYAGTILMVSHDRYLLERVCDHFLIFADNRIIRSEKLEFGPVQGNEPTPQAVTAEEKLLIETRLAYILGALNNYSPGSPDYLKLDKEYQDLIKRRKDWDKN